MVGAHLQTTTCRQTQVNTATDASWYYTAARTLHALEPASDSIKATLRWYGKQYQVLMWQPVLATHLVPVGRLRPLNVCTAGDGGLGVPAHKLVDVGVIVPPHSQPAHCSTHQVVMVKGWLCQQPWLMASCWECVPCNRAGVTVCCMCWLSFSNTCVTTMYTPDALNIHGAQGVVLFRGLGPGLDRRGAAGTSRVSLGSPVASISMLQQLVARQVLIDVCDMKPSITQVHPKVLPACSSQQFSCFVRGGADGRGEGQLQQSALLSV